MYQLQDSFANALGHLGIMRGVKKGVSLLTLKSRSIMQQ